MGVLVWGGGVTFPSLAVVIPKFGAGVLHKVKKLCSGGKTKKLEALEVAQRKYVGRQRRWHGVSISELLLRKWRGEFLQRAAVSCGHSTGVSEWACISVVTYRAVG